MSQNKNEGNEAKTRPSIEEKLLVSAICVALAAIIWLCLYFAAPIRRLLGVAGMNVVTRIMGIVLTVIAFQMLTEGLKKLLPGLA